MPFFRPNTWDDKIWDSIVTHNRYNIKDNWPHNIIDIGGHIGAFTHFMLNHKGSYKSVILEPDLDNFRMLKSNLQDLIDDYRVLPVHGGIGHPDSKLKGSNPDLENTGGIHYVPCENGNVNSYSLDSIIDMLDDSPILLKIHCEGCEYEALKSCSKLFRINAIVGEFHTTYGNNENSLRNILEKHNFAFSHSYSSQFIGFFGAHQLT